MRDAETVEALLLAGTASEPRAGVILAVGVVPLEGVPDVFALAGLLGGGLWLGGGLPSDTGGDRDPLWGAVGSGWADCRGAVSPGRPADCGRFRGCAGPAPVWAGMPLFPLDRGLRGGLL